MRVKLDQPPFKSDGEMKIRAANQDGYFDKEFRRIFEVSWSGKMRQWYLTTNFQSNRSITLTSHESTGSKQWDKTLMMVNQSTALAKLRISHFNFKNIFLLHRKRDLVDKGQRAKVEANLRRTKTEESNLSSLPTFRPPQVNSAKLTSWQNNDRGSV